MKKSIISNNSVKGGNKNDKRGNEDDGNYSSDKLKNKNNATKRTASVTPQINTSKKAATSSPSSREVYISVDPRLNGKRRRDSHHRDDNDDYENDEEDERLRRQRRRTTMETTTSMNTTAADTVNTKKKKNKSEDFGHRRIDEKNYGINNNNNNNNPDESNDCDIYDLSLNVKDSEKKFAHLVKYISDSTKNKIRNKQQTDLVNGANNNNEAASILEDCCDEYDDNDTASSAAATAVTRLNSAKGDGGGVRKKSTLTLNARPRNFHEFALILYTLSKLPKQTKDSLKRNIRAIFENDEIKICVGAFKRKTARELFQFLTYQIGNPQNLKNQVKKMYNNYSMRVDDGLFSDKYMISIPDLWYPFADDRHCYWNGFETLKDTLNSWDGYNLDGNVCERCMTFFITANKHGACPELYRTELTEIKRRQTVDVRSSSSSSSSVAAESSSNILISKTLKLEDRNEDGTKTTTTTPEEVTAESNAVTASANISKENTNFDIEDLFSMRDTTFTNVDIPSDLIECILNCETNEDLEKISAVENNNNNNNNLISDEVRSSKSKSNSEASSSLASNTTRMSCDKRKFGNLNNADDVNIGGDNNDDDGDDDDDDGGNRGEKGGKIEETNEQRRRQKSSSKHHQHHQQQQRTSSNINGYSTTTTMTTTTKKKKKNSSSSRDHSIDKQNVRDEVATSSATTASDSSRHSKNFDA